MDPTVAAFLRSWTFEPWVIAGCAVTGAIYLRGWRALVRRGSVQLAPRHAILFLAGLATLIVALCSPIEAFVSLSLSMHMAQHLLLMFAAPLLLVAACPQLPLTVGLPTPVLEYWVAPAVQSAALRRIGRALGNPLAAFVLSAAALWMWHVPRSYELALESTWWHRLEHACFFATSLLFWWVVFEPYPARPRWPREAVIPLLFAAAMQASVLCAFLTFADRVIYPRYAATGGLWGMSPLTDQQVAGAMMWVAGLAAYLVPLGLIGYALLYGRGERREVSPARRERIDEVIGTEPPPATSRAAQIDLLRLPLLGRGLRSVYVRRVMQITMLLLAAAIVLDGLTGPPAAPLNLAGVLPWIHWRGLVVLGLLVGANFFCAACPITLPRAVLRRFVAPRYDWPPSLRSKWVAVGLVLAFFWAYELFDLWSSPWWTAWIVVGYFVAATAIDMAFRGAAFCKYVCPIGQFQFVQSLVSPWEVQVREAAACTACRGHDCLRGAETTRGCEMQLFVPRKAGNLDCTLCLDCVRACPADNIGLLPVVPAAHLAGSAAHVAADRSLARPDLAWLIVCLVFAAFANAAGMIAPVVDAQDRLAALWGVSPATVENAYLAVMLVVLPIAACAAAGATTRLLSGDSRTAGSVIAKFAAALVPLGAAMWLAHYGFHFATGVTAWVPAAARFLNEWGVPVDATGHVVRSCCAIDPPAWLLPTEIVGLQLGLLGTLYLIYRTARADARRDMNQPPQATRMAAGLLPWSVLALVLFVAGVWILFQPMEMRGTLPAGSAG